VYYGMQAVDGSSEVARKLVEYELRVLDALHIRNGASHGEVIMTPTGPCLVEVGARPHGGEGTFMPMADACWGFNQVGALADSVISDAAFAHYPDCVPNYAKFAYKVDFICFVTGTLKRIDRLDEIAQLPAFLRFDLLPKPGDAVSPTIDCFTTVGTVTFVHSDKNVVMKCVEKVRELEKTMFIV
jgi:hypothetical protein